MKSKKGTGTGILALVIAASGITTSQAQIANNGGILSVFAVVDIVETIIRDTKACLLDGNCAGESGDDSFEVSKVQAMSNEELEEYVSKRK